MKRFLACVATAIAVCLPSVLIQAEDDDSAGRVRLSQDTAPPPPVPHAIGSGQSYGGPVYDNGGQYPLPMQSPMYQEYMGGSDPSGSVGYQLSDDIFTVQYRLNRRFGSLYGYEDSYTDIGMFIPRIIDNNSILFADLRGFVTDDRDGGFNFGVGHRRYNAAADRVWSNALWLDYDSGHVKDYFRGGYSGSMTSRFWRYRWNGYWIMNDQNNFIGTSFGDSAYYRGNNIVMDRTRVREVAYGGFDATIGGPIPLLGQYGLNWDFGLYYNTARHGEDGVGFIAKADAQITEDVQLGVSYTDDRVFGSNAQMYLSINLPDGRPSRIMRQPRVHDYMLRPDDRNYRVATKRYQVNDTVAMQNECLDDFNVAHILPDAVDGAAPSGDGSIDNPFNSLAAWEALSDAQKAAFDIILVRPGTEVTSSLGDEYHANLNTGITIFENHRLLASTGRLVRSIEDDDEVIRWAGHEFNAYVDGRAGLNSYILPGTDGWAGREFDPFSDDPRPILTNHITMAQYQADSLLNPAVMYNVVTIDGNFSASCAANPTEVSGFIVDGTNPNLPTILNSGIVSGNYTDPLVDRAINSFNINSNAVVDTVHAINIISANNGGPGYTDSEGDTVGRVDLNIVQGAGFRSNSGIHVEHIEGEMKLSVSDNLVFGVFGEDIDNDGWLLTLPNGHLSEDGINRENGKLDGGEDINGDGMISVNEDNDRDGVLGQDDHGIAINVIANGPNSLIKANYADITLADGTVIPGYNISRNTTYVSEAEVGTDLNGYVTRKGSPLLTPPIPANTNTADTVDFIGNRSGINLEAVNGGTLRALVADNDTSHNNPWADRDVNGNFTPPEKNEDMLAPPVPRLPLLPELDGNGIAVVDGGTGPTSAVMSNGFGIRVHANGAGSQVEIDALTRHTSNNNYGNGAVMSARNGGQVDMLSPMMGEVILNNDGKIVEVINPSEFNNNGLNGLLISADGPDSSLSILIGVPQGNFVADDATTSGNEASLVNDVFSRVLNTFNGNGTHFASGYSPDAFENGNGITLDLRDGASLGQIKYRDANGNLADSGIYSGIYHAQMNSNRANGLLIDLGDDVSPNGAWLQNFTVDNSDISGNGLDGISISAENLNDAVNPADLANGIGALHNLRLTNNIISANGTNGINFQLENSDLTSPVIQGNQITALLQSPDVESLFDIDLVFGSGFTAQQRAVIAEAADRWSRAIIGDLPDVTFNGELIDDIRIMVSSEAIDGDLNVLAVGGFSFANLRDDATQLPYLASITFDEADINWMEENSLLFDVAVHEMGHALGFLNQYWQLPTKDLVAFNTATDPRFTGSNATATYNSLFGVNENGAPLQSNGANLAGGHWREDVFGAEIMTPIVNPSPNPMSGVTIAAMQDLGYTVNMNARDQYTPGQGTVQPGSYQLTNGQVTAGVAGTAELVKLADHVVVVDPSVFDTTNLGSAGNGINLSVNNSNLVKVLIEDNNIHDNNGEGIRLVTPQFRTNGPGVNTIVYSLNTINNNGGHGINMILDNDNRLDTVICLNDISGNALGGINVELTNNAYYDNGTFDGVVVGGVPYANGNSFSGNTINDNGGIGYHISAKNNSEFELIGSSPVHSTLNGNQDAGLGIEMHDNSQGTVVMENFSADGNLDDDKGQPGDHNLFHGDGVAIVMNGRSVIRDLQIGSMTQHNTSLSDNYGDGLRVAIQSQTAILDDNGDGYGTIVSNVIANNNGNGNDPGVGNGMSFSRQADALFDKVWVRGSTIGYNNADGIDINIIGGANSPVTGTPFSHNFLIGGTGTGDFNTFLANNVNQIDIFAGADAITTVDIINNRMYGTHGGQQTAGDGIEAQAVNFGQILGTWQGNTIVDSGTHGISIIDNGASEGVPTPAGAVPRFNVSIYDNIIQRSGTDGINITGNSTELTFDDSDIDVIARIDGNVISNSGNDGIRIFTQSSSEFLIQTMDNNWVGDNGRNGLSLEAYGSGNIYVYQAVENVFTRNQNHGVNVELTHPGTTNNLGSNIRVARLTDDTADNPVGGSFVEDNTSGFVDNIVTDNGQNGYNVVLNNGSGGQDLTVRIAGSSDPTANNGATATSLIAGNGGNGIRLESNVTNLSRTAVLNASVVNNAVIGNGTKTLADGETRDELNGIYLKAGTTTSGSTNASFINNYVSGSGNTDFVFHTFAATPDPATLTSNNYTSTDQIEPLARVNIEFIGNKGGSLDVMRDSDQMQLNGNATYNNADPWKSPSYIFHPNVNGQTQGTSRHRNATREIYDAGLIDTGNVLGGSTPTATSVIVTGLINRSHAGARVWINGNYFDVASSTYNAANGQTTLTLVSRGFAPGIGPVEVYFPNVAGGGDTTLRVFGSNAMTLITAGANAGGNNFTTVITDFNDEGQLSTNADRFLPLAGDQWYEFDTIATPFIFLP